MSAPNGIIIYRGPSLIDGSPIICIATGITKQSKNGKTGDMIQTWIMREDIAPNVAVKIGADVSVCGHCMHSPTREGTCYVRTDQAPRQVWKTYHQGGYPLATDYELRAIKAGGRKVRAGAYGDPAAIPLEIWETLGVWTGYTHQWKSTDARSCIMASVDNETEAMEASEKGWRYFRVRPIGAPLMSGEIDCPSSRGVSCESCGLCGGLQRKARNISIEAHGAKARRFTGRKLEVVA